MKYYVKMNTILNDQIERSFADSNSLSAAYLRALNMLLKKMSITHNLVYCTRKTMMIYLRDKTDKRAKKLMPLLEDLGFWIKIKRSHYMINPMLVNSVSLACVPKLFAIYLSHGGNKIALDGQGKADELEAKLKGYNTTIEIEIEKEYESRVRQGVEERISEVLEENKMNLQLVKSLTKQLDAKDKQIEKLLAMLDRPLSAKDEQEIQRIKHLTLVK